MFISIRLLFLVMMSADAHSMMIGVFMRRMTLGVPLASGRRYRLVTRKGLGGVRAHLGIYTRTCGSCVGKYYTSIVVQGWRPPLDGIDIGSKSMIACVCICMASYSGVTYRVFF